MEVEYGWVGELNRDTGRRKDRVGKGDASHPPWKQDVIENR